MHLLLTVDNRAPILRAEVSSTFHTFCTFQTFTPPRMSPLISFYFQVHQPYRLRDLRITEIGRDNLQYFDEEKNRAVFRKVAEKCYLPANRLLLSLLQAYPDFHISY